MPQPQAQDFDIGDTSGQPLTANLPDARPRNPDGTFAKTESQQPQEDHFRAYLASKAAEFGFSDQDISDMPTAAIQRAVSQIERDRVETQRQFMQAQVRINPPQQEPVQRQVAADADDLPIDEEELHPSLVKSLKAIKEGRQADKKLIESLKKQIEEGQVREHQRTVISNAEKVDDVFEALGEKYAKIIGSGAGIDLVKSDPEAFKRRVAILNEAGINIREPLPPMLKLKALIQQAAKVIVGFALENAASAADPYAAAQAGKTNGNGKAKPSADEWAKGGLAAPTHRDAPEMAGDAKAVRELTRNRKQYGLDVPDSIDDFIP